jgi:HD-GYP domain-containing protein (c-di-GMP phosphodiesterase class II)
LIHRPPRSPRTSADFSGDKRPSSGTHCQRSYQFAAAFAKADGIELDVEVLYLGTVLHDVGPRSWR